MDYFCILSIIVLIGYVSIIKAVSDITATDFIVYTDWAHGHNIRLFDLNTGSDIDLKPKYPLNGGSYPQGIAYHSSTRTVFFTVKTDKKVCKFILGVGSDVECIYQSDKTGMKLGSLALDDNQQKLYISDSGSKKIYRISFDGSNFEEVYYNKYGNPYGLFVDTQNGFLYFSDNTGTRSGVTMRAPLDDLSKPKIIAYNRGAAVALHINDNTLYWTDMNKKRVMASNLDGSSSRVVTSVPAMNLHGITGVGPHIYVADLGDAFKNGMIYKVEPETGLYTEVEGANKFNSRPYLIAGSN